MKTRLTRIGPLPPFVLLILLVSQPSVAQFQGKIFTTPEERAYLDALREDFLKKSQEQGFDIDEAGPPPLPESDEEPAETSTSVEYSLGGILTRSDGSHTVWINNQPVAESVLPANMRLIADGQLAVLLIETAAGTFQLKPGQTLNASTGAVQEAYQRAMTPVDNEPAPASDAKAVLPSSQLPPNTAVEADTREAP